MAALGASVTGMVYPSPPAALGSFGPFASPSFLPGHPSPSRIAPLSGSGSVGGGTPGRKKTPGRKVAAPKVDAAGNPLPKKPRRKVGTIDPLTGEMIQPAKRKRKRADDDSGGQGGEEDPSAGGGSGGKKKQARRKAADNPNTEGALRAMHVAQPAMPAPTNFGKIKGPFHKESQ
jgi:hypothetical protein